MAEKITGKVAVSAASKVLRDGRTNAASKTAAESALSQREKVGKENKHPQKSVERFILSYALLIFTFLLVVSIKLN